MTKFPLGLALAVVLGNPVAFMLCGSNVPAFLFSCVALAFAAAYFDGAFKPLSKQ